MIISVIHSHRLERKQFDQSFRARSRDKILIEPSHSREKSD